MKNLKKIVLITLLMFSLMNISNADASIFDHFNETRSSLEEKGIAFEAVYTIDYLANTQGGLQRKDTYLSNLDLTLTVDTAQLGLWEHGTFFAYMIDSSGGDKISGSIVGDTQGLDNIEAPRTTRLYEMWYEHSFLDETLAVLIGFHDYNSEFDVTEYGGLYLNSSFGISVDISGAGRPSIFPLTAVALRVKVTPNDHLELLFAVYDGDPGDPDISEHFPRSDLDADGGAFIASEVDFYFSEDVLPGVVKLGVWHNTGEFDDIVDTDPAGDAIKRNGNTGGYLVIDKMLFREEGSQGLGGFLQFGANKTSINEVNVYVGGGLNYHGLIPGRDEDDIGIAVASAFINEEISSTSTRDDHEITIEATYSAQVNDHIRIQPDLQYIINPGAVTGVKDAFIVGVRVEVAL